MLQIYKASAGSGKTFSIVRDYLFLAFNKYFGNILAVTFTNNAAIEMKNRIINELISMTKNPIKSQMFRIIENEYPNNIHFKTTEILTDILHNYSDFQISTIDSFVSKVVRAFTFDLKINSGFEIDMDTNFICKQTVDNLLLSIDNNYSIRNHLKQYVIANIEENKSWDIRASLENYTKIFFLEKTNEILSILNLQDENFDYKVDGLKKECYTIISNHNKDIDNLILVAKKYLNNFEGKILNNLLEKFIENKDIDNFLSKKTVTDIIYANEPSKKKNIENLKSDFLLPLFNLNQDKNYLIAKRINKSIYNFGLIKELNNILMEYRQSNDVLFMVDLTLLLKKMIENIDAPFIYERIGNRISNLMIDEFQDTSDFQWFNFIPIIQNTLSTQPTGVSFDKSIIVGDTKQAIYRWRNGNWNLLETGIDKDFGNWVKKTNLDVNYRSFKNIVDFNNLLFSSNCLPSIFYDSFFSKFSFKNSSVEQIKSIYSDSYQNPVETKIGGFVKISLAPTTEYKTIAIQWFENTLSEILNLNDFDDFYEKSIFKPSDICIITRSNNEANEIVKILLNINLTLPKNKRFGIISTESLNIQNSNIVNLLINIFKFIYIYSSNFNEQKENELKFYLFQIAIDYSKICDCPKTLDLNFFEANTTHLLEILPTDFSNLINNFSNYSLIELTEKIIMIFNLNNEIYKNELPFLRTFEEIILEFEEKKTGNIFKFLEFWELKAKNRSVMLSRQENSISVMTIHKSKGLTFEVVFLPFLSWDTKIKDDIMWFNTKKYDTFNKYFEYLPLNIGSSKELFDEQDFEEQINTYIDNLNMIYVAFTRAVKAIYGCAKVSKNKSGNSIGDLLNTSLEVISNKIDIKKKTEILNLTEIYDTDNNNSDISESKELITYIFGEEYFSKTTNSVIDDNTEFFELPNFPSFQWTDNIAIVSHSEDFISETIEKRSIAIKQGIIIHKILELLNDFENLNKIIEDVTKEYSLSEEEKMKIENYFTRLQKNEEFIYWFENVTNVYAEREILTQTADTYRPDRVIEKDNKIIVIDYKSGQKRKKDKQQLEIYKNLLKQIYFQKEIKAYLLYISENEIVELE